MAKQPFSESHTELSTEDIEHIARLGALEIAQSEIERYRVELSAVIGYVERLAELDLDNVEPLVHVGDEENRLAEDISGPVLSNDMVMKLGPECEPPFFVVPRVLGTNKSSS